ncbi:MAG: LysR family transcriptional regulator [Erysipelotrichaceae bacterium]|nr:LysR family transcriptional regulator [Erysipelotrichaceae bacterium]
MLDYRLLTFMNLYQTMNYTKTAKNLKITQPAVTQHIKYLEAAYQVKLFHYAKKKLTTTKEGEYLYRCASALQANSSKVFSDILCLNEDKTSLKLGASPTIAQYWMPAVLKRLEDTDRMFEVELTVDATDQLVNQLRRGEIDMAFVEGNFDSSTVHAQALRKEEIVLAVPVDHELSSKGTVSFNDILDERLLHGDEHDVCGAVVNQALQTNNLSVGSFRSHMVINDNEVIKQMIKEGIGIGFVYQSAIREELAEHALAAVKIKGCKLMREFFMIYLNETIFKDQFQEFYHSCQMILKDLNSNI